MNAVARRRLGMIQLGLVVIVLLVVARLILMMVIRSQELQAEHAAVFGETDTLEPIRGQIVDRNGVVLATTGYDYRISVAPNQVSDPQRLASILAPPLEASEYEIRTRLEPGLDEDGEYRTYSVVDANAGPEAVRSIRAAIKEAQDDDEHAMGITGLTFEPLPHRYYPQGAMASQVLGIVSWVESERQQRGNSGVEGYYNSDLTGDPVTVWKNPQLYGQWNQGGFPSGSTLVLTIDRTVQYVTEQVLSSALTRYNSKSGTIIVMDPRDFGILAMASLPSFDPSNITQDDIRRVSNPAVSNWFEPGSIHKVLTMAAAIDSGTVRPETTYEDRGVLEVGGHPITNWDRAAHGTTDMVTLLAKSLNIGAATIAQWMGQDTFYAYMDAFGFGGYTGVDLAGEVIGRLKHPGDDDWAPSDLGTNSFGQGLSATPLQELAAIASLANGGKLLQPHVVNEIRAPDGTHQFRPSVIGRPISAESAETVTWMMAQAVAREVPEASVPGYAVAGKTGTAQVVEGGVYHPTDVIGVFVGFLPVDDPQVIVLVKIDRPQVPLAERWGSMTAAPVFAELARQLVVLLDIPPDAERATSRLAQSSQ